MQTQSITAEQTSRNRYSRQRPLPPREIELTIRIEIPEETGADVGITSAYASRVPPIWEEALDHRLSLGVHGGLATVGAPLPVGGVGVQIARLAVTPPLDAEPDPDDIQRLGATLEALASSTVAALWTGLLVFDAPASR